MMETEPLALQGYQSVFVPLDRLEDALGRHCRTLSAGSWRPNVQEVEETLRGLADQVVTVRYAVDALQRAQRDERRRFGHDVRVLLGTIAGWVHILRQERNASDSILRAADVLDRNVRALTKVIESAQP
jgi:hypothetical protein